MGSPTIREDCCQSCGSNVVGSPFHLCSIKGNYILDSRVGVMYIGSMKSTDYSATIEYLPGQGAAIVALFDSAGQWSGAGRIEVRSGLRSDLYEAGYHAASASATIKGGRLARFSVAS